MARGVYLNLKEAAAYLQEKGLRGQSVGVLREAIARGKLAALKDGRSWATTSVKLDEYEARLWREAIPGSCSSGRRPGSARGGKRGSKIITGTSSTNGMSFRQAMVLQRADRNPKPAKRRGPLKSQPQPEKPKRERKPKPEEIEQAAFMALPAEEKKQRFREYLDGKRDHWRDVASPKKEKRRRGKRE